MKAITLKQISVNEVYVSVLTAVRETNEEGWTRWKSADKTFPATGSVMLDAIVRVLATEAGRTPLDVARAMGTDTAFLNELFRLLTGMTATDFFHAYQLKQVCEWLSCTDLAIKEISLRCGFKSHAHLTQFFTRKLAVSPKKYRQMHRPKGYQERYKWREN